MRSLLGRTAVAGSMAVAGCLGLVACVDSRELFSESDTLEPAPSATAPGATVPDVPDAGPSAGSAPATGANGSSGAIDPNAGEVSPSLPSPQPVPMAPGAAPPADEPPVSAPSAPPVVVDPTGQARICPEVAEPLLLDFEETSGASQAFFGNFSSVFSGGTFVYPEAGGLSAQAPDAGGVLGLASDVSAGDWHVSGLVGEPSGLGLFFECEALDASRFAGVAFRIQGTIEGERELTFFAGSAANDVSRAWLIGNGAPAPGPSFGRCTPAATRFDGSCQAARISLRVTEEPVDVVVPFAALAGGSPEPGLNPAELTALQWSLPPPALDASGAAVPYGVNLRIDDIRFVVAE